MNKLLQSIYVIKIDSMMCTQSVQSKRQSLIFCAIGKKTIKKNRNRSEKEKFHTAKNASHFQFMYETFTQIGIT